MTISTLQCGLSLTGKVELPSAEATLDFCRKALA
jgi:hypothetical protein